MAKPALDGRRTLISGGTGGLGSAMAQEFAREGARVAICGRDIERTSARADALGNECHSHIEAIELDLHRPGAVAHAVHRAADLLGGLDIVVCAAGAPADGRLESITAGQWRDSFEVKFFGVVEVMTQSLPYLRNSQGGVMIALSGLLGREPDIGNIVAGSINAALENFMKCLSREVAGDGIRALTLSPGPFDTPRIRNILMQKGRDTKRSYEDLLSASVAEVPMRRHGTPEEFARLAAVLASDVGSFLTGTTITIDGGLRRGAF